MERPHKVAGPSTPRWDEQSRRTAEYGAGRAPDQKHVQDLEPDRGHGEKVYGHQAAQVIVQKGPPSL
jgi:hypothetical protein